VDFSLKKESTYVAAIKKHLLEYESEVNSLIPASLRSLDDMLSGKIVFIAVSDFPYSDAANYNRN
jgi:hypothetical protein